MKFRRLIWKVCRVTSVHAAIFSAKSGADYVGLQLIRYPKPYRVRIFKQVVRALAKRRYACRPILLTKMTDPVEIARACRATKIRIVQLHYPAPSAICHRLLAALEKQDAEPAKLVLVTTPADAAEHPSLKWARNHPSDVEAVIVDSHWRGGTGVRSPLLELKAAKRRVGPLPVWVAGGVAAENVREIVGVIQPAGVDVESHLQLKTPGRRKDGSLLLDFAASIGRDSKAWLAPSGIPHVSLGMSTIDPNEATDIIRRFANVDIDAVHLDFSDQSLHPGFAADTRPIAERLRWTAPCLPYEIHLYLREPRRWRDIVASFLSLNRLLQAIYVHVIEPSVVNEEFIHESFRCGSEFQRPIGYTFQATRFTARQLSHTLDRLRLSNLTRLSLLTHSSAHAPTKAWPVDRILLEVLCKRGAEVVTVDRDMTLGKLSQVRMPGLSGVVMGQHLISSPRPQRTVDQARRILVCE